MRSYRLFIILALIGLTGLFGCNSAGDDDLSDYAADDGMDESYDEGLTQAELAQRLVELKAEHGEMLTPIATNLSKAGDRLYNRGNYTEALEIYLKEHEIRSVMAQVNPSDAYMNLWSWAGVQLGRAYDKLGEEELAREVWTEAAEVIEPLIERTDNKYYWDTYAQALLNLGRVDEAKPFVDRLLALGQNNAELLKLCRKHGLIEETAVAAAPTTRRNWPPTIITENRLKFQLPDLSGQLVSAADERFQGKVLLVDIWGSWHQPELLELPQLIELQDKYREQGLEVVGVAFEKGPAQEQLDKLKKFVEDHQVNYTVLYGGSLTDLPAKLPEIENFRLYPTLILIGRDGQVSKVEAGFTERKAQELEQILQELLGSAR